MFKSLKSLLAFTLLISFSVNQQVMGYNDENLMTSEKLDLLLEMTNNELPENIQVANINVNSQGIEIYLSENEEKNENLTREQLDQIHETVVENYSKMTFSENVTVLRGRPTYENVYGNPVRRTFSGYAGNQPAGGNRFSTGGGFYYSDSGGPTVSISIAFAAPYGTMSVGVSLGISASSGKFVTVPDTINYYKLYVEKTYDCKPYITYYTDSLGNTSVFYKGTTNILYNQNQYAKKV